MKRRAVRIDVSDHAVVRYLERALGFDIDGLRNQIAEKVMSGATLGAVIVTVDGVKLALSRDFDCKADARSHVVVTTVLTKDMHPAENTRRINRKAARPR